MDLINARMVAAIDGIIAQEAEVGDEAQLLGEIHRHGWSQAHTIMTGYVEVICETYHAIDKGIDVARAEEGVAHIGLNDKGLCRDILQGDAIYKIPVTLLITYHATYSPMLIEAIAYLGEELEHAIGVVVAEIVVSHGAETDATTYIHLGTDAHSHQGCNHSQEKFFHNSFLD